MNDYSSCHRCVTPKDPDRKLFFTATVCHLITLHYITMYQSYNSHSNHRIHFSLYLCFVSLFPRKDTGPYRNQDETVELAVALNLDPRKPGQALRGSLSLPHGTGKVIKCVVFTDDKTIAEAALEKGAIHAGGETLVNQIARGDVPLDFDRSIASQNMMSDLSKIARSLGPRGLMPNAKVGTLVKQPDMLLEALKQQMDGQLMYRTDKEGVLHFGVGKGSFGPDKLLDNIRATMEEIYNIKPEMYGKGKKPSKNAVYMLTAHVTATQGKGIKVDLPTITPTSQAFMSDGE